MTAGELLDRFERAFIAQQEALGHLGDDERRRRTERPGQYHLDAIADAAVLSVVAGAETRVLSEESGWTGPSDARVTIVVDPVDGSTNCARRLPYWAISLCAVDRRRIAVRVGRQRRDGRPVHRDAWARCVPERSPDRPERDDGAGARRRGHLRSAAERARVAAIPRPRFVRARPV